MATATRCLSRMKVHNLSGPLKWGGRSHNRGRAGLVVSTCWDSWQGVLCNVSWMNYSKSVGDTWWHLLVPFNLHTDSRFTLTVFWPRDDRCSNFDVLTCCQLCFTFILSKRGQLSKSHSVYLNTALFTLFSLYVGRRLTIFCLYNSICINFSVTYVGNCFGCILSIRWQLWSCNFI